MRKRNKKHKFKLPKLKFLLFLIILIFLWNNYYNRNNILDVLEKNRGIISNYYIYGIHFNIEGSIKIKGMDKEDINLVLKSKNKEIDLDAIVEVTNDSLSFKLSDKINGGYNLNKLTSGKYYLLLKTKENKYYSFKDLSSLNNLEYYTVTKNSRNYKVDINYSKKDEVLVFNVQQAKSYSYYDITIDAGHGNIDTGSSYILNGKTYYESDLTLNVALSLKEKLVNLGYKVLLTRDDVSDLDYYGKDGRAVIPNKYKTKLTISIHLNSDISKMNYGGLEVYTPNDIDYSFAKDLAKQVKNFANTTYSLKKNDYLYDGVYYSYFDESKIKESYYESIENDQKPYDIEIGAPEMYMIREVGGKMTKAYIDGRNSKIGKNYYFDSSIASESYLIEIGYISYCNDLKNIINNYDKYAKGMAAAINSYLK